MAKHASSTAAGVFNRFIRIKRLTAAKSRGKLRTSIETG
jgi:hypothetical protein